MMDFNYKTDHAFKFAFHFIVQAVSTLEFMNVINVMKVIINTPMKILSLEANQDLLQLTMELNAGELVMIL